MPHTDRPVRRFGLESDPVAEARTSREHAADIVHLRVIICDCRLFGKEPIQGAIQRNAIRSCISLAKDAFPLAARRFHPQARADA